MCLLVKSGPHVAKRNMKVYKTIKSDNRSAMRNFQYSPHGRYDRITELQVINEDGLHDRIEDGYHSFPATAVVYDSETDIIFSKKTTLTMAFTKFDDKLVEFVIPKGATYYVGKNGDYVSNRIGAGDLQEIEPTKVLTQTIR